MSDHEVTLINDSMQEFYVRFLGPSESESASGKRSGGIFHVSRQRHFTLARTAPFHGGAWKIHVELPDSYPYKSPSIGFTNKIFHPNIDESSGSVCLDVINQTWSPMFDLVNVFEVFLPQLLRYPNPSDPLNGDAASLLLRDPSGYETKVKDYVKRYANAEAAKSTDANGNGTGNGANDGSDDEDEESEEEMSDAGSFEAEDEAADMEL